jgi:hypothetical protein
MLKEEYEKINDDDLRKVNLKNIFAPENEYSTRKIYYSKHFTSSF